MQALENQKQIKTEKTQESDWGLNPGPSDIQTGALTI